VSLHSGSRLGSYQIVSAIGAGGMGEVFRARDTRLNRDVAIKVLPATFAHDKERVARFLVRLPKEKILWQSDMINDGEYPENASTRDFAKKVKALRLKYESVVGLHGRSKLARE
jgi:serine/threonine protein kinase